MPDKAILRRIVDLAGPWVLLIAAAAGLIYVITVAATLRDLRALEPVTLGSPGLETSLCASATGVPVPSPAADGEPRLNGAVAPQQPLAAERSANCPPHARQVRPQ
jgi:hypothetical protein